MIGMHLLNDYISLRLVATREAAALLTSNIILII